MITKDDFRIHNESFDLTNPMNSLRILAGAGFIPHAFGKFANGGINPATLGFFEAAGYAPASLWIIFAAIAEIVVGVMLVLGIATRFSAFIAAAILVFALGSLIVVAGFGWFWNTGGIEYLVFWILVCLLVCQYEFIKHKTHFNR